MIYITEETSIMKQFRHSIRLASILLASMVFFMSSCGGSGGKDEPDVPTTLQAINILGTITTLTIGQQITLTATANPSTVTLTNLVWSSSNKSVATVNSSGTVTAIAAGTATIKASALGKTDEYDITVSEKPATVIDAESIDLQESATIELGQSKQLVATVSPSNATSQTITWTSSDTSIASVNNGLVEAKKTGSATIVATVKNADNSEISSSCEVEVVKYATSLTLDKSSVSLEQTETAYLYATVLPSDATYNTVTFSSSNESIATVDRSGKITPVNIGTIIITATLDNGAKGTLEAKCTVAVTAETVFATDLSITPSSKTLESGQTVQIHHTVTPSNATYQTITWSSSNSTVASVNSSGLVTANNEGTATITVTLQNGTQPAIVKTATITVTSGGQGGGDGISDNGEIGEVGTN